jgi:hypothetical protein
MHDNKQRAYISGEWSVLVVSGEDDGYRWDMWEGEGNGEVNVGAFMYSLSINKFYECKGTHIDHLQ